jgi:hypothetical protein
MLKEQFEIAAAETRIRTPELIDAARLLLVEKEIYRAAKSIEDKWESICKKRGWSFVAIALPKRLMKLMLLVQSEEIADYRKFREKKKSKKLA